MSILSMDDYRAFVAERSIYPGSGTLLGALYCGLKMAGEAGELLEHILVGSDKSLILKEAGDVLWYVIASERELKLQLTIMPQDPPAYLLHGVYGAGPNQWGDALSIAVSQYTESLGKSMRDGGAELAVTDPAWQERLRNKLKMILWCIAGVGSCYDHRVHHIAELNVSKLKDRDARGVTKGDGDNR